MQWLYRIWHAVIDRCCGGHRSSSRCASHRAQGPRAARRRDRQRQRLSRTDCCGVSAMSGPGAATCRTNGAADLALRHPVDRRARRSLRRRPPSWRGARTRWPGTSPIPAIAALTARFADGVSHGTDARRHRPFQSDEDLLRDREVQAEGPQGRRRLRGARRAALGVQSRPRPFFGTIFEIEDRAGRDRDVPRRLRRSRHHAARRASRSSRWTAPAPMASSSATSSCPTS